MAADRARTTRLRAGTAVVLACLVIVGAATAATALSGVQRGEIGPSLFITGNGRHLTPAGRMTQVGDFPTGGALTPDGRFYWAVDSGHGHNDVQIVDLAHSNVLQVLPLPGAYGGIAFNAAGTLAYVSGEPRGSTTPTGPTVADAGDAVHVFFVDRASGHALELPPITLPPTTGGTAQIAEGGKLDWPEGIAVTPDGKTLLVALNQADALAVIDLTKPNYPTRLVHVGKFPYGVAADPNNHTAYVTNELDGTVSIVDLNSATVTGSVGVGGSRGNLEAHPEGLLVDAQRHLVFVAVTNRDLVVAVNPATQKVVESVSVQRSAGIGSAPLALAESPDRTTLYAADSGEDALAVIHIGSTQLNLVGRIPTAAYPSAVAITGDGKRVVWLAAKGLGAGPNPNYGTPYANSGAAPYGSYVIDKLLGYVGVLATPNSTELARDTKRSDAQVVPANATAPPAQTPVVGPKGGPSTQIKHVFYVVKENRTYDQIFGSDPRGDGDPALEVLDDNGVAAPPGGVTPNAHSLARRFPLIDHFYADSEVSVDGHVITDSSYAIDFVQKAIHADYGGRNRVDNAGVFPETYPPNDFVFDQAVRQHIPFTNLGEFSDGLINDGRPTYAASLASQDIGYPVHFGCDGTYPNLTCSTDSGHPGQVGDPAVSRYDYFQQKFNGWLKGGKDNAPSFVYMTLPNDHTNGVAPGKPTPQALVADNDLGLGQIVQLISHSSIWHDSAIFVVEDDSQDGADHVDAHRMPAYVISPYARSGAVVHTRYDQYSALHTMEMILGLHPLSLFDALATPMYDVFTMKPNFTPYDAIQPEQSLNARNPLPPTASTATATAAAAKQPSPLGAALQQLQSSTSAQARAVAAEHLAMQLPFDHVDLVPQELSDEVLWHSVYGWASTPPPPGPDASALEQDRADVARLSFEQRQNVAAALEAVTDAESGSDADG
jgi:YVTN family beta-propeller protein